MNIKIIAVGKIKEKYFQGAITEYSKRLSRYCKLNLIEVPDKKAPERLSEAEMTQVKDDEGSRIIKHIDDHDYVITLEIHGKELSSEAFSNTLSSLGIEGKSNIAFIIGGSLGLSERVKARRNFALSFSNMTFPHQLMRVILLEQVYRAFRIMKGEPYHK